MQELDFILIASFHHRLKQLRTDNWGNFLIEVDGGVNADNAAKLFSAGADVLVAGGGMVSQAHMHDVEQRFRIFLLCLNFNEVMSCCSLIFVYNYFSTFYSFSFESI
jgi:hypothetical protein